MNLGVDIVDEILSRLPVKSLTKFKVVCKDWYSHIHSNCFIAKHLKNQNTNEKALMWHQQSGNYIVSICIEEEKEDDDDDDDEVNDSQTLFHQHQQYRIEDYLPLDSSEHYVTLIGTCNGLVCLHCKERKNPNSTYNRIIYLWNPATTDFKTLPSCESQHLPPGSDKSCLLGCHTGFGFDSTSNDYKVIRVGRCNVKELVNKAMVYSLNTNSWRELDNSNVLMEIRSLDIFSSTILLRDKVYWSILAWDMLNNAVLLSFDMEKEVFQMTPLPYEYIASEGQYYDLKGPVCFTLHDSVALVGTPGERGLAIWTTKELEQGRASWIKVLNIGLSSRIVMRLGFWKCKNSNDFLFMFRDYYDGNNVMKGIYINNRGEIKNGRMVTIYVEKDIVSSRKMLTYVESLVSVNRSKIF